MAETTMVPIEEQTPDIITEEHQAQVRNRVKELSHELTNCYYRMAKLLYEVYYGNYFENWGYAKFEEWTEKELGFKKRKAQYFVAIWDQFGLKLGVDHSRMAKLDWSKVKEIQPVVTKDNVNEWLERAETQTYSEIKKAVKEARSEDEALEDADSDDKESKEKFVNMKFTLAEAQAENVRAALNRAAEMSGSEKTGHQLDLICSEFNASYVETEDGGAAKRLDWYVANLERIFGVKIDVEVPEGSALMNMAKKKAEPKKDSGKASTKAKTKAKPKSSTKAKPKAKSSKGKKQKAAK